MTNSNSQIQTILTLDDKPHIRETLAFPVEMADRTPLQLPGPLGSLDEFLSRETTADAAITDYQLRPGHYADFDGDELVAAWYKRRFPAVLCTSFATSNVAQFRRHRRWIPVVMSPSELNPDSLMQAIEFTGKEIRDEFAATRRPWRALVRFVEFHEPENIANAIIAGWGEEVVALRASDLEEPLLAALRTAFKSADEYRCFATANLGAEANGDLYVTRWEI